MTNRNKTPKRFLTLAFLAFSQIAQAVVPAPDGGYPGGNTAEGQNALFSLTSGGYNTAVGYLSLRSDATGNFNTAVGAGTLLANTADQNTATGTGALLSNTTGSANTASGAFALFSNTTGEGNTAIGSSALQSNSTGESNTASGSSALSSNTTGVRNTANGVAALFSNTIGNDNTANGVQALYYNTSGGGNTADGAFALFHNTLSDSNTGIGYEALFHNAIGSDNTAIGYQALFNTTGNNNIAFGRFAGGFVTTGSNNIEIGNEGVADEDGTIRIGDAQTRAFIAGIRDVTTGNGDAIAVVIDSAGQLGTMSSSARFKKDIQPMDQSSDAILKLKPVTFHYKDDHTRTLQFGLIAEDVAKVNPALVVRDANGDIHTVRYDAVNAMLLNEFLKEHRRVEQQSDLLENQAHKIREQETTIGELKKEMEIVVVRIKEQESKIQRVSDRLELSNFARGRICRGGQTPHQQRVSHGEYGGRFP